MFNADDIKIVRGGGSSYTVRTDDRDTSSASATIKRGEPVKRNNANFALRIATGDPEIGTDILLGIASSESTELAATEGTVEVTQILPQTVLRGVMTTPSNANTDAELLGIELDYVTFDVTGTIVTINENENDDPNVHGLFIIGGDIVAGTLDVLVHMSATLSGTTV